MTAYGIPPMSSCMHDQHNCEWALFMNMTAQ